MAPTVTSLPFTNAVLLVAILFVQMIYVTMVYGPIAAFLVELFPTSIRYTSMSLPYHLGNGWVGGFLPLAAPPPRSPPRPGRAPPSGPAPSTAASSTPSWSA